MKIDAKAQTIDGQPVPIGKLCHVKVFLDGVALTSCIRADDREGMVECYELEADGRPVVESPGCLKTSIRYGAVRIEVS